MKRRRPPIAKRQGLRQTSRTPKRSFNQREGTVGIAAKGEWSLGLGSGSKGRGSRTPKIKPVPSKGKKIGQ